MPFRFDQFCTVVEETDSVMLVKRTPGRTSSFYVTTLDEDFGPFATLEKARERYAQATSDGTSKQKKKRHDEVWLTYDGKSQSMRDWARETGINPATIWSRFVKKGWSAERALTQPVFGKGRQPTPITFRGETLLRSEWAARIGITAATLNSRLTTYGWTVEEALTTRLGERRGAGSG